MFKATEHKLQWTSPPKKQRKKDKKGKNKEHAQKNDKHMRNRKCLCSKLRISCPCAFVCDFSIVQNNGSKFLIRSVKGQFDKNRPSFWIINEGEKSKVHEIKKETGKVLSQQNRFRAGYNFTSVDERWRKERWKWTVKEQNRILKRGWGKGRVQSTRPKKWSDQFCPDSLFPSIEKL